MRTLAGLVLGFLISFPEISESAKKETPKTVNIAATNLKAEEGVSASMASIMSDILRTELYKTGHFSVMNREDMDSILKEIKFQQSGACDQTACIVEMGQALGVDRMVAGTVGMIGDNFIINAKLINIATQKNEILVTEYQAKSDPKGPQTAFRKVALKLAGLEESIEAPLPSQGGKGRSKPAPKARGFILRVGAGSSSTQFDGSFFYDVTEASSQGLAGTQHYGAKNVSPTIGIGYQFHKFLAFFVDYSGLYAKIRREIIPGSYTSGLGKVSLTNIAGLIQFSPLSGKVRPYLALGGAFSSLGIELDPGFTDTIREGGSGFGGAGHIGLEYKISQKFEVFGQFSPNQGTDGDGMSSLEAGLFFRP